MKYSKEEQLLTFIKDYLNDNGGSYLNHRFFCYLQAILTLWKEKLLKEKLAITAITEEKPFFCCHFGLLQDLCRFRALICDLLQIYSR